MVRAARLGDALGILVRALEKASGARRFVVMLVSEGTPALSVAASALGPEFSAAIDRINAGSKDSVSTRALAQHDVVEAADLESEAGTRAQREAAKLAGLRSCASAPIFGRDSAALGTLDCYGVESGLMGEADASLLQMGAGLASLAVAAHTGRPETDEELASGDETIEERFNRANRELDALTYALAHDMRDSYRTISSCAHEVLTDVTSHLEEQSRDRVVKIGETVRRLGLLSDSLLRIATLTRGGLKLQVFDFTDFVRQIARDVRETQHHETVQVRVQPDLVVRADPNLVELIVEKLLENGCLFCVNGPVPTVDVGMSLVAGRKAYWVRDNGPGFSPALAQRMFEPIERQHVERDFPGAAMALVTVRRLVERHGGRAWAQSVPGRGTVFYFTLGEANDAYGESEPEPGPEG
ncbi:MAG: GAF domain-containing protein [Fimbriimonas ginsengisoli]|uniref:histidine kinase n=1 Tax=Fimbriimonas ginsengisoli TaxID=1005039 RepID=A0A931LVQ9_FIMGI|nr:GAF domain-containing protein [Fimbriimonas ginsengisoli]